MKRPKKPITETDYSAVMFGGDYAGFGNTPTGDYSIADLINLLSAKDVQIARIDAARNTLSAPFDMTAWDTAWTAVKQNYANAKVDAQSAITSAKINPLPNSLISAQTVYTEILNALNIQWQSHGVAPGSLDDLVNQLTQMGGQIDTSTPVPQPNATDWQLEGMKAAQQATKPVDQAGAAVANAAKAAEPGIVKTLVIAGICVVAGVLVLPKLLPVLIK